jgi:zinc and cadmium transporter
MDNSWFYALLSTVAVSVISLIGIFFLSFNSQTLQRILFLLVSFAIGGFLGNVFFHLLPESYEQIPDSSHIGLLILSGFLIFFLMEKVLHHRHLLSENAEQPPTKSYGYLSLYADAIHNFTDGVLIAAGWMVSPEIGLTTTLAVILHEIPQEISDYGILIHAGFKKGKALLFNFYAACSAILGTVVTLLCGTQIEQFAIYILPFAAGGFIYLAASSLIPELQKENSKRNTLMQVLMIGVGLLVMFLFNNGHGH